MKAAQIICHALTKSFGDRLALENLDLALQGGITTVLGPNGAGKTTLLRCLATVLSPDSGSVWIDGLDPVHESDRIEIRRRLGYQPQNASFAASAKVFDAIDYVAVLKGFDHDRHRRQWVFHVLDQVGLRDRARDRIGDLSGGMIQRIGLAQALLGHPSLLILDEPAAGLDPDERFRIRDLIAERREDMTVLVSTHLTDEAAVSDRIVVLNEGQICFVGSPDALAEVARGHTWIQAERPNQSARASWRQADGKYRCLGEPPDGGQPIPPTLADGYLMLISRSSRQPA